MVGCMMRANRKGETMFGFVKERLAGAASRFSGKTDLLEATCAAIALVSSADGDIEDAEMRPRGEGCLPSMVHGAT